jgi:hypothetical protein
MEHCEHASYIEFYSPVNTQAFRQLKRKVWSIQNNWTVYIITYNMFWLISNFLDSTVQEPWVAGLVLYKTGTVLDITNLY